MSNVDSEYWNAWNKWRRICDDNHYSKCLNCGKDGIEYSYEDVESVRLLVNDPKRSTPKKIICRYCGVEKPWLEWRDYGLKMKDLDNNLRQEHQSFDISYPWKKRKPLWTI